MKVLNGQKRETVDAKARKLNKRLSLSSPCLKPRADGVTEVRVTQWDTPQHGRIPAGSQLTFPNSLLHMLTSQRTPSGRYLALTRTEHSGRLVTFYYKKHKIFLYITHLNNERVQTVSCRKLKN